MNINWFPGHMKKTRELLQNNLKLIDVVYELLDSRIPISSRNPEIDKIVSNKPRIIILNKSDLSNQKANQEWVNFFEEQNLQVALINASKNIGTREIFDKTQILVKDKLERLKKRGIKNKPIRAMIVGIPNVGKSTLINSIARKKSAKTGNKPGVTKGKQWIKLREGIELLDTPGILWPKFEDENVGLNLAFTGAIKDEIMDIETLSLRLVQRILSINPELLENRYGIEITEDTALHVLDKIAVKRGCLVKSGKIDYSRVANIILDEFRDGTIGRISLEYPKDLE